ncbi:cell division protein FtsQ/DivIB [Sphingomonas sp. S2-65]|uniref:cell division protein FtsQ/DivIB n=1 Tax=Sphingomonas sp. S2-65 TaxID=2903960 RepID=UPI001F1C33C1|nr:cell division protein FtsQ/DivIB [Sphingomonas sp. S2-65]UYY59553.1 FtsQ-type POTRA domain-containing protein [Sphingomonas sp. S2-65]
MSRRPVQRTATRRGATPKARKAPARRPKRPGMLEQAVAALPFSEKTLQGIATWSIVGAVGAAVLALGVWAGIPGMVGVAAANTLGDLGLKVDQIQVDGNKRMDKTTIIAEALDGEHSRAMPLVDLKAIRERLLQYPWVQDARVSRRLPDTLRVFIVEREPAAVWQNHGQLMLVDTAGVPLEPVSREAMPELPLLVGDGANSQEPARRTLLDAAPALKPLVRAATWIGNRRWDLTFSTGEKLQLPEGDDESRAALRKFAELDGEQRLLGKGSIRFDMRVPGNMVVQRRMAPAVAATAADATKSGE